ncbi:MAG TPA: sterol desaturase family protein [Acidimicrobiales bacterium]
MAAGTVWLGMVGLRALLASGTLGRSLSQALGSSVGPALIVTVVALLAAERRWPAVPGPLVTRAHLVDGAYLVLFALLVVPALSCVQTGFAVEVGRHARFVLVGRLPLGPQAVVVGIILLATDALNWLVHLANHRSGALWRLHALHHSQEEMSVLTTFRTHPLVHATYLPILVPVLVLASSGTVPGAALAAYGCLVALPHANLRWTFGPIGRVVVSPAYHRLHHARAFAGPQAVNLGFVLVCWDRLAGRSLQPATGEPVPTGIAGHPVPVEQDAAGARTVRTVLGQLTQPFVRRSGLEPSR